jgi:predicted branched-subunit amino acid permease
VGCPCQEKEADVSNFSSDFKRGFFIGAGVITAAIVVGFLAKKV